MVKPTKTYVSPRSSPLETSRAEERLRLNKSGSHGVPNVNLFNVRFLLVDSGKVLCSSANELQQKSNACPRQDYILQILTVFFRDSSRLHLTFVAFCLLKNRLSLNVWVNVVLNRTVVDSD